MAGKGEIVMLDFEEMWAISGGGSSGNMLIDGQMLLNSVEETLTDGEVVE